MTSPWVQRMVRDNNHVAQARPEPTLGNRVKADDKTFKMDSEAVWPIPHQADHNPLRDWFNCDTCDDLLDTIEDGE